MSNTLRNWKYYIYKGILTITAPTVEMFPSGLSETWVVV